MAGGCGWIARCARPSACGVAASNAPRALSGPPCPLGRLLYRQPQSASLPRTRCWHLVHDSNVRPPASKTGALDPAELTRFCLSGAERGNRTPDARAFNAPLYLLSYLGKPIWRPVRDSNPRLPTRQAGTLATELTRQCDPSGHGFRRRPIVAADFHPRSVSSTRVPCAGVACGIRTRVSILKEWCPRPSRRTRLDWWCPRRRFERAACRLQGGCSAC